MGIGISLFTVKVHGYTSNATHLLNILAMKARKAEKTR